MFFLPQHALQVSIELKIKLSVTFSFVLWNCARLIIFLIPPAQHVSVAESYNLVRVRYEKVCVNFTWRGHITPRRKM